MQNLIRNCSLLALTFLVAGAGAAVAASAQEACRPDYQRLCSNVRPGGGHIVECLGQHQSELSAQCKQALGDVKAKAPNGGKGTSQSAPAG